MLNWAILLENSSDMVHFQSFDFDAWDQAPPTQVALYFLLTCCEYTVPEEAAGDAEYGDELPCPHCGGQSAVYCIQGHRQDPPPPIRIYTYSKSFEEWKQVRATLIDLGYSYGLYDSHVFDVRDQFEKYPVIFADREEMVFASNSPGFKPWYDYMSVNVFLRIAELTVEPSKELSFNY